MHKRKFKKKKMYLNIDKRTHFRNIFKLQLTYVKIVNLYKNISYKFE